MATITHDGGSTGHPGVANRPYLLEVLVDIAEVDSDITTIGTTDTIQVLNIPAGTLVMYAGINVLAVESTNTTSKFQLGDGSDTARFVDAGLINATGNITQAATMGDGIMYDSADTIDILISVDDPTNAKVSVWAVCVDFTVLNTTDDNKTYS
jgi:hypothetical protein